MDEETLNEAIATLITVTGTTPELAAQYVQLADGDANQAVQLFFENGGVDLAGSTPSRPPAASTSFQSGHAHDPINIDDDELITDENDPEGTGHQKDSEPRTPALPPAAVTHFEDDEAMARRLQQEMYGEGGVDEPLRAPIARQSETLVGAGESLPLSRSGYDAAVEARMRAFQSRQNRARAGIFNQQQPASIWERDGDPPTNSLSESTGGASEASQRNNRLARLFQPPWELMYKGEWEDARDEGKEHKKWLLVDIQDPSIFDCQALNRDLWKNEGIVETVRENFVFLQYNKDDPRANQYIQYYFQAYESPDMYPHVAIVDPRTGEQIKLWTRKIPPPSEFLMQLHEFLDRYSLENSARNPVAKRKSEAKKEKPIDQLTEDEMLQRALQASLASQSQEVNPPPDIEDPDDLTRSVGDVRGTNSSLNADTMDVDEAEPTEGQKLSDFGPVPPTQPPPEPAAGPGITRVQIRHPGGRIVRRFAESDPVQRIYDFLKTTELPEGKEGADFELISMGKNLNDLRQETVESAGLKNGTVMVEFLD